jgi:threonine aldolase
LELQQVLVRHGVKFAAPAQTNQIFVQIDDRLKQRLATRVSFSDWDRADDTTSIIRLVTSWANTDADIEEFDRALEILE